MAIVMIAIMNYNISNSNRPCSNNNNNNSNDNNIVKVVKVVKASY